VGLLPDGTGNFNGDERQEALFLLEHLEHVWSALQYTQYFSRNRVLA